MAGRAARFRAKAALTCDDGNKTRSGGVAHSARTDERGSRMLYYANGGPGPATGLLRVDAPKDGSYENWRWHSKGERWSVTAGWFDYPDAQAEILNEGEYTLIDDSQVPEVQQQMASQ